MIDVKMKDGIVHQRCTKKNECVSFKKRIGQNVYDRSKGETVIFERIVLGQLANYYYIYVLHRDAPTVH